MRIGVSIVAMLACAALPAGAALYKWIDSNGRVQYTDTPPPPEARKVEEQKIIKNTIATDGQPFAVQDAAKRNPVTLWTSDCGELCTKARDYLSKRGVPYSVRNPSRANEQEAWKRVSGGGNEVPLLLVGTARTLKGFDEGEWAAALDAAGYPRTAPPLKPVAIPTDPPPPAKVQVTPPSEAAAKPPAGAAQK